MGRDFSKGLVLAVGFLSSCSLEFLPSLHASFVIPLLSSWIFVMYTKFFTDVSWVMSVDALSSTPNLSSLTRIFSQFPIYTVLSTCSSSSFSSFWFSLSLFVSSSQPIVFLVFSSCSESSSLFQHIIADSILLFSLIWKLFLGQFFCASLETLSFVVLSQSFCTFSPLYSLRSLSMTWLSLQKSIISFSLFSSLVCIIVFPFQIFRSSIKIAPKVLSYQEMSMSIICMIC